MPITDAMQRWLAPARRVDKDDWSTPYSPPSQQQDVPEQTAVSLPPTSSAENPSRKRKQVPSPVDVDDMAREGFICCNRLRCVESFVLGKGDIQALRAEQDAMVKLTGAGRASFVHTLIPLVKPGRNKGSMMAGNQLVCTGFFRRAFGTSNNVIQSLKGNPGSPALKGNKRARFGTACPAKEECLGYIDRFAESYGQLKPHENTTYLSLGSMKELYEDFAEDRSLNGEDPISYPYFARMWRKHRSTVKPKSGNKVRRACDQGYEEPGYSR